MKRLHIFYDSAFCNSWLKLPRKINNKQLIIFPFSWKLQAVKNITVCRVILMLFVFLYQTVSLEFLFLHLKSPVTFSISWFLLSPQKIDASSERALSFSADTLFFQCTVGILALPLSLFCFASHENFCKSFSWKSLSFWLTKPNFSAISFLVFTTHASLFQSFTKSSEQRVKSKSVKGQKVKRVSLKTVKFAKSSSK